MLISQLVTPSHLLSHLNQKKKAIVKGRSPSFFGIFVMKVIIIKA